MILKNSVLLIFFVITLFVSCDCKRNRKKREGFNGKEKEISNTNHCLSYNDLHLMYPNYKDSLPSDSNYILLASPIYDNSQEVFVFQKSLDSLFVQYLYYLDSRGLRYRLSYDINNEIVDESGIPVYIDYNACFNENDPTLMRINMATPPEGKSMINIYRLKGKEKEKVYSRNIQPNIPCLVVQKNVEKLKNKVDYNGNHIPDTFIIESTLKLKNFERKDTVNVYVSYCSGRVQKPVP